MKERSQELTKDARRSPAKAAVDGTQDVLDKIAAMAEPDRAMAERIHAIVTDTAPELTPRTWYGMPAYARGKDVVLFFQDAVKFKARIRRSASATRRRSTMGRCGRTRTR